MKRHVITGRFSLHSHTGQPKSGRNMKLQTAIIWTLVISSIAWVLGAEKENDSELPDHVDRPKDSPSATVQPHILDYDQLYSDSRDAGPHKRCRRSTYYINWRGWLAIIWGNFVALMCCCKCCQAWLKPSERVENDARDNHDALSVAITTLEEQQRREIEIQQLQSGRVAVIGDYGTGLPSYTLANPSACTDVPPPPYTVSPPLRVALPPESTISPPSFTEAMSRVPPSNNGHRQVTTWI